MRRILYLAASLAALAVVFSACNKERQIAPGTEDGLSVIRVSIPDALTKVSFTEITEGGSGLALAWQANDAIRVIGETSELFTISEGFSGHEAEFTGTAVTGNTFTILYPGSFETKEALGARDYASQTQNGNGSTAHLAYNAMLSGVDSYQDIAFTSAWAAAHGGNFIQNGVLKLVVKLPDGVTGLKKVSLKAPEELFCLDNSGEKISDELALDLTNVDVSASSQVLTAYMDISAQGAEIDEGTSLTISAVGTDDNVYLKEFTLAQDVALEGGKLNTIRLTTEEPVIFSDYFVTMTGAGQKNGGQWEDALGVAELRNLLSRPNAIDGATIHIAAGDYYLAGKAGERLTMSYPGFGKQVAVTFLGGYPTGLTGTDVASRDTTANCSAFTGNKNAAIFNLVDNVDITFDGLTFKDASVEANNSGALNVKSSNNSAKLTVTSCRFIDNKNTSSYTGAAVSLQFCSATISNTYFGGNYARNGSAVQMWNDKNSSVRITDCLFKGNSTANTSGAVQNAGMTDVEIKDCEFIKNSAISAGGVFHTGNSAKTTFKNCKFEENSTNAAAGVMSLQGASVICENCTFTKNSCAKYGGSSGYKNVGGGVFLLRTDKDEVTLNKCVFKENSSTGYGATLAAISTNNVFHINDCVFEDNEAKAGWGVALYLYTATERAYIDGCIFKGSKNTSRGVIAGGAGTIVFINRSAFYDNANSGSGAWGVAVHMGNSHVCMNNVTSYSNHCTNASPGNSVAFNSDGGWLITNSTIVDDTPTALVRANGTRKVALCNNILVNRNAANNMFALKTANILNDKGHNVMSLSAAPTASDAPAYDTTDLFGASDTSLGGSYVEYTTALPYYGIYSWNGSLTGFTAASQTDVENTLKTGYPETDDNFTSITNIGLDFYNWLDGIGALTVDGRNIARAGTIWPGSYQN